MRSNILTFLILVPSLFSCQNKDTNSEIYYSYLPFALNESMPCEFVLIEDSAYLIYFSSSLMETDLVSYGKVYKFKQWYYGIDDVTKEMLVFNKTGSGINFFGNRYSPLKFKLSKDRNDSEIISYFKDQYRLVKQDTAYLKDYTTNTTKTDLFEGETFPVIFTNDKTSLIFNKYFYKLSIHNLILSFGTWAQNDHKVMLKEMNLVNVARDDFWELPDVLQQKITKMKNTYELIPVDDTTLFIRTLPMHVRENRLYKKSDKNDFIFPLDENLLDSTTIRM